MKTFVNFWMLLIPVVATGQSFSGRTNDIKVDMKDDLVRTSFPVISWVTPALEYTNSQSGDINIEVIVTGELTLKEMKLLVTDESQSHHEKNVSLEPNAVAASFKQHLRLPDGKHVLRVSVVNTAGGEAISSRTDRKSVV